MNINRCDKCCDKLHGINGDEVYELSRDAKKFLKREYEHLCEECMDEINMDDEKLFVSQEAFTATIDLIG